jgi:formamidopyrimidine-DNA glycosylase
MPELPEVETIVRELREAALIGIKIDKAIVFWDRSIANLISHQFCQKIASQSILGIERRGKFLVFKLTHDTLLVHLRMTGKFLIANQECEVHPHERVRLYLSDNRVLRYEDQRKFGKWYLTCHPEQYLDKLGLEPLSEEFTLKALKSCLKGCNRKIKPFLLDQHYIVGLGNIYVDEALWSAKIHPLRTIQTFTEEEIANLHQSIIKVLKRGVKNIGTSLGAARANYFSVSGRRGNNQQALEVFRREGLPCSRCQTIIQKIVVAQRGTHFCPNCQSIDA